MGSVEIALLSGFLAGFSVGSALTLGISAVVYLVITKKSVPVTPSPTQIGFYLDGKRRTDMDLKVSQQINPVIVAEDKFGNPTGALDGAPAWSLSDPSLGTITASADGMSATVVPNGKLGTCQVQVSGQSDGKTIMGSLDLNLLAGDATQIIIQAGVPVDQPEAAPAP